MSQRPVTLFTGQWADLPLEKLAPLVKKMGYDGVELACWGDHFDVDAAATSKKYIHDKWAQLKDHGLTCYAISSHLVGQAVCDHIDERHKSILPADVWGDGDPEGVRQRVERADRHAESRDDRGRSGGVKRLPGARGKVNQTRAFFLRTRVRPRNFS